MGASGSTWLQRKVRRTVQAKVEQLKPPAIAGRMGARARAARADASGALRSVVDEGRTAMRDREAELHRELGSARDRRRAAKR